MSPMKTILAATAASLFAFPVFAEGEIMIHDSYARASGMNAMAGAAFFEIMNESGEDDRLIAAASDVAKRVELHTHKETAEGVMQMMKVEEGFPVPAGGMHALARGGDHVMFMGLNQPFEDGSIITVTLTFEKAGDMTVEIPIDLKRNPMGGGMAHGKSDDGQMNQDTTPSN